MLMFYLSLIDSAENRDKFERLYYKYRSLMMHVALSKLQDHALAEDCVHNAFLNILESIDKIRDVDAKETKALVAIITQRRAVDLIRKYQKETSLDALPEQEAPATEENNSLAEHIYKLPENQRAALILKYAYGYSTQEIASVFQITPSGVRKLIGRARNSLREELDKNETIK